VNSDHAGAGDLDALRREIADVDDALVALIGRRLDVAAAIGELKQKLGRPVLDPAREAEVVRRAAEHARDRGVDPELVRAVLWKIIDSARGVQDND
jgi:chorismate mutase